MHAIPIPDAKDSAEDFVYIVSHDLRALVRALKEIPTWIEEDLADVALPEGSEIPENTELLVEHAGLLDRMLVDLLTYSRVGRNGEPSPCALQTIVPQAVEELNIPDAVQLSVEVGQASVCLPPVEAKQVMKIIVENAVLHGAIDAPRIHVQAETTARRTRISVHDNGPGVPDAEVERMFQPMTSLKRQDQVTGSGMGLAIARKIVGDNGGCLQAGRSEVLGGFRLDIDLPAHTA